VRQQIEAALLDALKRTEWSGCGTADKDGATHWFRKTTVFLNSSPIPLLGLKTALERFKIGVWKNNVRFIQSG
jgi:hypothetical protein